MNIQSYFHPETSTLTYLVYDQKTKSAALIDSVLDYDSKGSTISFKSANLMIDEIKKLDLNLQYLLETHAHADHLSAISYFKKFFPKAKTAISERITEVQDVFSGLFNFDKKVDGSQFDILLKDSEELEIGELKLRAISTPGHTPACMTFVINDEAAFTGDLIFAPDYGTGRCDFPAGSSANMYESISEKLFSLSDDLLIYPGHDYMPGGRIVREKSSLREQKGSNIHLNQKTSKEEFISFRDNRDSGLAAPKLLLQSVQFNAWAAEELYNEKPFLYIPLRLLE